MTVLEQIAGAVFFYDEALVAHLVEEGRRVGRTPWCCSLTAEMEAYTRLNRFGCYSQETMAETVARRKMKEHVDV